MAHFAQCQHPTAEHVGIVEIAGFQQITRGRSECRKLVLEVLEVGCRYRIVAPELEFFLRQVQQEALMARPFIAQLGHRVTLICRRKDRD